MKADDPQSRKATVPIPAESTSETKKVTEDAVSVVGLGKLGACMAAAMASRGVRVIGADLNPLPVERLRGKLAPIFEPGLAEMIAGCDGLLDATVDIARAVHQTSMTFVVVPTPSNTEGAFSLQYVCAAMESIGQALRSKVAHHTVVLTSTVLPGSTKFVIQPLLEKASGKRCGPDFGLCYSPEFIALGSVLRDLLNPDLLLIGECHPEAGAKLETFYRAVLKIDAPVARMKPVNAELAKIALNAYVTTKITFANLLAAVCERLPDGDVDVVTSALGLDSRIGPKYLKGALGYGGPCFPRDNEAFARLLDELGLSAELPRTVDRLNRNVPGRVVSLVEQLGRPASSRVAVLGLTYKPDTNVVEESQGVAIAHQLAQRGFEVSVFDPVGMESAKKVLGTAVKYASSMADCVGGAEIVILATDWPEFRLVADHTQHSTPPPFIVDGWRLLRTAGEASGASYCGIGIGHPQIVEHERIQHFVTRLVARDWSEAQDGADKS
jgi:UDPglucose 6-dehydrogenase